MNYLSVEDLSKSFGEKVLFNNIRFGLEKGEKMALIARNGTGKSTLMRIIMGKETPESGKVVIRKEIRCGYLDQNPHFEKDLTIMDSLFHNDNLILKTVKEYEIAIEKFQHNTNDANSKLLEDATALMDKYNAWNYEQNIKQILFRLNITNLEQKVDDLSGGQRKRVALAKVLIEEPELIFMDEPTNHLDLDMIEWLEEYLIRQDITLLLVTHDRYFLDRVCNRIMELENGNVYKYNGNYEYFLEKKAEREAIQQSEISKAKNLMRKELEWVRRMPKARGTKSKYRMDAFKETEAKAKSGKIVQELELNVKMNRVGGKILELKKVYKSYGDKHLIKGFDYTFKKGERVGIVGKNGVGKSTFLNIITQKEQPDSGKVNVGDTIVYGYYSQMGLEVKEDKRIIEIVKDIAEFIPLADGTKVSASQFLELFQFDGPMQYTFYSKLSGGEKRRLHLLTVLIKNPNFLILDEPTNDLDLVTLTILEDFLLNYGGCLVIVSHDRYFMDKLVNHLLVFEGDGIISDYNGNYDEWRNEQDIKEEQKKIVKPIEKEVPITENTSSKKKLSFKEKQEYDQLPKQINQLESEKAKVFEELSKGEGSHEHLLYLSNRIKEIQESLDEKELRWLELSELV